MANNAKYLIEKFGCVKKDVAEYLGISIQSLSAMFNSDNPRKYCDKLAEYLKINSEYITKELDEKDERNILLDHYGITSTSTYREDFILLKTDKEITVPELISSLDDWNHRQIESIHIRILTKGLKLPYILLREAEIRLINNQILMRSIRDWNEVEFSTSLINRVISRKEDKNLKHIFIELKNSLTFEIAINYVARYGEET